MSPAGILKVFALTLLIFVVIFVLSLVELYTQLGRYSAYWQKNNQKPAVAGELLYVALGDSTAQGIGATSPARGYVGLIEKDLKSRTDKPVRTVNLSKSGAKAIDVLNTQLPKLNQLDINDDTIITIQIGANNMINFNKAEFENQMDEIMSKLPKQTLITDIPYFGESRYKNRQPNVDQANKIMYKLADKHNFKLVKLHERMKQNGGIKTFAPDWFHPSNIAYKQNWAYVFINRIEL